MLVIPQSLWRSVSENTIQIIEASLRSLKIGSLSITKFCHQRKLLLKESGRLSRGRAVCEFENSSVVQSIPADKAGRFGGSNPSAPSKKPQKVLRFFYLLRRSTHTPCLVYHVVAFKFFDALKISLLLIWPINTPFSTTGNRLTGLFRNSLAAATISQPDSIVFTLAVM